MDNKEIIEVSKICEEKKIKFILFTAESEKTVKNIYENNEKIIIISYNTNEETTLENSTIPLAPIIIPAYLFLSTYGIIENNDFFKYIKDAEKFVKYLYTEFLVRKMREISTVYIFYENDEIPAVLNLEYKLQKLNFVKIQKQIKPHPSIENFMKYRVTRLESLQLGLAINFVKRTEKLFEHSDYIGLDDEELVNRIQIFELCRERYIPCMEIDAIESDSIRWNIDIFFKNAYIISKIEEEFIKQTQKDSS